MNFTGLGKRQAVSIEPVNGPVRVIRHIDHIREPVAIHIEKHEGGPVERKGLFVAIIGRRRHLHARAGLAVRPVPAPGFVPGPCAGHGPIDAEAVLEQDNVLKPVAVHVGKFHPRPLVEGHRATEPAAIDDLVKGGPIVQIIAVAVTVRILTVHDIGLLVIINVQQAQRAVFEIKGQPCRIGKGLRLSPNVRSRVPPKEIGILGTPGDEIGQAVAIDIGQRNTVITQGLIGTGRLAHVLTPAPTVVSILAYPNVGVNIMFPWFGHDKVRQPVAVHVIQRRVGFGGEQDPRRSSSRFRACHCNHPGRRQLRFGIGEGCRRKRGLAVRPHLRHRRQHGNKNIPGGNIRQIVAPDQDVIRYYGNGDTAARGFHAKGGTIIAERVGARAIVKEDFLPMGTVFVVDNARETG
ncbi:MAG: hypothetical protein BWY09_00661 [Candidatus Hydrogenedentes bacterium ADurb.Bin179]|nr:MAG: hypothetical protein BWY09_00661 [Candidatus Hydrogenedentes bacterium ADurb.Bin179]